MPAPRTCPACRGFGEVPEVRPVSCCSGRNVYGQPVCGCGGWPIDELFYVPCPRGCAPAEPPVPAPPFPDPHDW